MNTMNWLFDVSIRKTEREDLRQWERTIDICFRRKEGVSRDRH